MNSSIFAVFGKLGVGLCLPFTCYNGRIFVDNWKHLLVEFVSFILETFSHQFSLQVINDCSENALFAVKLVRCLIIFSCAQIINTIPFIIRTFCTLALFISLTLCSYTCTILVSLNIKLQFFKFQRLFPDFKYSMWQAGTGNRVRLAPLIPGFFALNRYNTVCYMP